MRNYSPVSKMIDLIDKRSHGCARMFGLYINRKKKSWPFYRLTQRTTKGNWALQRRISNEKFHRGFKQRAACHAAESFGSDSATFSIGAKFSSPALMLYRYKYNKPIGSLIGNTTCCMSHLFSNRCKHNIYDGGLMCVHVGVVYNFTIDFLQVSSRG